MQLRRRNRTAEEAPANHSEVWPAYVDVLSAAFVFILLAFLALMTRDAKSAEEREHSDVKQAQLAKAIAAWEAGVKQVVEAVPEQYKAHLRDDVLGSLTSKDELLKACVAELPTNASATFDDSKLDSDRRQAVTVVCTLRSDLVSFDTGRWEPDYTPDDLQDALVRVARDLTTRECYPGPLAAWCSTGFEVVGHADCRPVSSGRASADSGRGGRPLTNWELSTNRSGAVIRDMLALGTSAEVGLRPTFDVFAGGRETRERLDALCDCSSADSCHDKNRRVVVKIKLKTPPLDAKPTMSSLKVNP